MEEITKEDKRKAEEIVQEFSENPDFDADIEVWGTRGDIVVDPDMGSFEVYKLRSRNYTLKFTSKNRLVFSNE